MLFISPDVMLIMATKVKDSHNVTFNELVELVRIIKKNLGETKIKVIVPTYPSLNNGNGSWQRHFYVYENKYHPFNTGGETDKYYEEKLSIFKKDLMESGLSKNEVDDMLFSVLAEYKVLVNSEEKSKKRKMKRSTI